MQLNKFAQEWADKLFAMGKDIKLDHSNYSKKYGEAMYFKGGKEPHPVSEVINLWYGFHTFSRSN
jgi:hypothetical protein